MKNSAPHIHPQHTDIEFMEGMLAKDPRMEQAFYLHCRNYFYDHCHAVFFTSDADSSDIFQNTFISVWQNIERGKIYVADGRIMGNGAPLNCSLTTYFMSVARNKYLEFVRSGITDRHISKVSVSDMFENDEHFVDDWLDDDYENAMYEVLSDSISVMPPRCSQILTKFYYENKKLDEMLCEMPSYTSKDALKSNKNRCLERLRTYALSLYNIRKSR